MDLSAVRARVNGAELLVMNTPALGLHARSSVAITVSRLVESAITLMIHVNVQEVLLVMTAVSVVKIILVQAVKLALLVFPVHVRMD
jgi:hypothetical protein